MARELETPPKWPYSGCESVEDERRHRKEHLAAAFRLFARYGLDEGVAGHITVHVRPNPIISGSTPSAMPSAGCGCPTLMVNSAGEVIEGGKGINRSAFAIHSQIHAARPDVVAAAHSHSVYGKAWAALARPFDMITQDHCDFFEDHSVYDSFDGVVVDAAEVGASPPPWVKQKRSSFAITASSAWVTRWTKPPGGSSAWKPAVVFNYSPKPPALRRSSMPPPPPKSMPSKGAT